MATQTSAPFFGTLNEAAGLFNRFKDGETFRHHVEQRLRLIMPVCCLMLLVSVCAGAGVLLALGQVHRGLALAGVLLMPVVLIGSLFVQAYLFFAWLENRALAHRSPGQAQAGLGKLPPVPWLLASALILIPLALLATVAWHGALVVAGLAAFAPFAYAMLDR